MLCLVSVTIFIPPSSSQFCFLRGPIRHCLHECFTLLCELFQKRRQQKCSINHWPNHISHNVIIFKLIHNSHVGSSFENLVLNDNQQQKTFYSTLLLILSFICLVCVICSGLFLLNISVLNVSIDVLFTLYIRFYRLCLMTESLNPHIGHCKKLHLDIVFCTRMCHSMEIKPWHIHWWI